MPIGQDRGITHKTCPFKSSPGASSEIGRSTSPKELCSHACALYDEKEQLCAFRVIALRMSQPLALLTRDEPGADALEKHPAQ